MLDPFMPVYYTGDSLAYHADPECRTFSKNRRHNQVKPRRSRLASMLATRRTACLWCAPDLTVTPAQAHRMLTNALAVPA